MDSNLPISTPTAHLKNPIANQCFFLLAAIFLQIFFLFFLLHSSPPHAPPPSTHNHLPAACPSGNVYVYHLPAAFNSELVDNCHDLNPWKFSGGCRAVANGGFGPKAAAALSNAVPYNLTPAWYWTDMYTAEVIFHRRMLTHRCRTLDPSEATGFYIPFYAGLAVGKYLFREFNYTHEDRDRLSKMLLSWLADQPRFTKHQGVDHFIVLGRLTWDFRRSTDDDSSWGSSFLSMPLMKNVLRLSMEKHTLDYLEESVPYPTGFHPRSESDVKEWQSFIRSRRRTTLFSFAGAKREKIKNDFRQMLMDYCLNEHTCRAVDCGNIPCSEGSPKILESFLDSDFCLQPKGDGMTRRSMFDCMIVGSIPIYFWKGSFKDQYVWHLPWVSETFTVYIDHNEVRDSNGTMIKKVLEEIRKDNVREMRETLINLVPKLLYASSSLENVGDAFDVTVDRVLRRLRTRMKHLLSEGQVNSEI